MKYYIIHGRSKKENENNIFHYITKSGHVYNFGFMCRYNFRRQAIRVSEQALERDILKIYLGYIDHYFEEVDIVNDYYISSALFSTPEELAPTNFLQTYYKKYNVDWCVSPSELLYLDNQFCDVELYKIKTEQNGKIEWLTDRYNWTDNKELGIIVTEDSLRHFKLLFKIKSCKAVPTSFQEHFTNIYYTYEDIEYLYDRKINY